MLDEIADLRAQIARQSQDADPARFGESVGEDEVPGETGWDNVTPPASKCRDDDRCQYAIDAAAPSATAEDAKATKGEK